MIIPGDKITFDYVRNLKSCVDGVISKNRQLNLYLSPLYTKIILADIAILGSHFVYRQSWNVLHVTFQN